MANLKYKEINGTSYHEETKNDVCLILENLRLLGSRITLDYGDVKTGQSWCEVYDITGTIGRSMGPVKVPLLIHNSRSLGGGAILDHCIVKITSSKKPYEVFYQHKSWKGPKS